MLVVLLMTGAVAYYAPHAYAYKITAFLGLVPLSAVLATSGNTKQMALAGFILILAGFLPTLHQAVYRALMDALDSRRNRALLSEELEAYKALPPEKVRSWPFGTGLALQAWLDARASRA